MTSSRLKIDPRRKRTRDGLLAAFFKLVLSRRYHEIRIADILSESGVSRSTFYEHFASKDELLSASIEGPFLILAGMVCNELSTRHVERLLVHFWENRALARGLFQGAAHQALRRKLVGCIESRLDNCAGNKLRIRADWWLMRSRTACFRRSWPGSSERRRAMRAILPWLCNDPRRHPLRPSCLAYGMSAGGRAKLVFSGLQRKSSHRSATRCSCNTDATTSEMTGQGAGPSRMFDYKPSKGSIREFGSSVFFRCWHRRRRHRRRRSGSCNLLCLLRVQTVVAMSSCYTS